MAKCCAQNKQQNYTVREKGPLFIGPSHAKSPFKGDIDVILRHQKQLLNQKKFAHLFLPQKIENGYISELVARNNVPISKDKLTSYRARYPMHNI